jgi:hypothetical protein
LPHLSAELLCFPSCDQRTRHRQEDSDERKNLKRGHVGYSGVTRKPQAVRYDSYAIVIVARRALCAWVSLHRQAGVCCPRPSLATRNGRISQQERDCGRLGVPISLKLRIALFKSSAHVGAKGALHSAANNPPIRVIAARPQPGRVHQGRTGSRIGVAAAHVDECLRRNKVTRSSGQID